MLEDKRRIADPTLPQQAPDFASADRPRSRPQSADAAAQKPTNHRYTPGAESCIAVVVPTSSPSVSPIPFDQPTFSQEITAMYEEAQRFHEETDRDLERRVKAFLADRNLPALRRLAIHSQRGVVTLRGRVRTFYEKQLGGQSARRVAGVVDVIDAIYVRGRHRPARRPAKSCSHRGA